MDEDAMIYALFRILDERPEPEPEPELIDPPWPPGKPETIRVQVTQLEDGRYVPGNVITMPEDTYTETPPGPAMPACAKQRRLIESERVRYLYKIVQELRARGHEVTCGELGGVWFVSSDRETLRHPNPAVLAGVLRRLL